MDTLIRYVDNFYPYPELIREIALRSEFYVPKSYVGYRSSRGFLAEGTVARIQSAFGFSDIKLVHLRERSTHFYNSLARGKMRVPFFVHYDLDPVPKKTAYAMLVYLTPGAPEAAGTALYRHRETGIWKTPTGEDARRLRLTKEQIFTKLGADASERSKWEETQRVANVFNRAVLFPAHLYHSSAKEFGSRPENGKLYQIFFFYGQ